MTNEIIPYLDMCQREGLSLQKGMNYQVKGQYSIILMSQRPNAPYRDRIEEDGSVLIYEGHNIKRSRTTPDPKLIDQPEVLPSGSLTENGKFHKAAKEYKQGLRQPIKVKVYEKIHGGIWSYLGTFDLVDSWKERDERREVFKFKLLATLDINSPNVTERQLEHLRIIPTSVKLAVWKRDDGKCVKCGATNELHFDHIIPYSKGGSSMTADNIQLLCARHNLEKRDKIE